MSKKSDIFTCRPDDDFFFNHSIEEIYMLSREEILIDRLNRLALCQ